jgi:hypothetical protein
LLAKLAKSEESTCPDPVSDPDDTIDPDDSSITDPPIALLPSNTPDAAVASIAQQASEQRQAEPPPEQAHRWWTAIVLGCEDAPVSQQDAQLALQWVAYRLESNHLSNSIESSFSFHSATTVGELHAQIRELYGEPGWDAAYDMWAQGTCITQPVRKDVTIRAIGNPIGAPVVRTETDGTPFTIPPDTPPKVAAFFGHDPKPTLWRRQETAGEAERRVQATNDGAWCG